MGREHLSITVTATVSRHNSPQDEQDDRRWDELRDRIADLCREYSDIGAETT